MRNLRTLTYLLALTTSPLLAQSVGIMAGASQRALIAAGRSYTTASGMSARVFMPFYVHDRAVVRAELGISSLRGNHIGPGEASYRYRENSLDLAVLGRYYLTRKFCLSSGSELTRFVGQRHPVAFDRSSQSPRRSDLGLVVGAALRCSDRMEFGVRVGQGLLPAVNMGPLGVAHNRYGMMAASFLIKSRNHSFVERRQWRNALYMAHRY